MKAPSESRLERHRERVQRLRRSMQERFDQGVDAVDLVQSLALQTDGFLVELFDEAAEEFPAGERLTGCGAVLAIGGSGRAELSPGSDVDLLFLDGNSGREFAAFASQAVRDCWDVGLQLGHSVHTVPGAISLARSEIEFATAVIEARWLWGDRALAETFRQTFWRRVVARRPSRFYRDCVDARRGEWARHGRSASELVPDVKRSPGGLRDVHLVRWLGFCRYGTTDLSELVEEEALLPRERDTLVAGHQWLTEVRVDLHLSAARCQDVLTRDEQLRLAKKRGVEGSSAQRPVERFMQDHFRHTTALARVSERFAERNRPPRLIDTLADWWCIPRRVGSFWVTRRMIDAVEGLRGEVTATLSDGLRLFETSARYGVDPSPQLLDVLTDAVGEWTDDITVEDQARFLAILGQTGRVGTTLRQMFHTRVLDQLVPAVSHARCLMQFNQYHSFTVDEHTFRAVEAAESLAGEEGPVGATYRAIVRKDLLHLALLLHDLGKGFDEDHSEVGRRIALETAERLGLDKPDTDRLVFLVHRHLAMEQLATRRDISEPGLVMEFSHEVGSPQTLRMLYALTAADIIAVGPGKWTEWKAELLTALFDRALVVLGGERPRFRLEERLESIRQQVLECSSFADVEPGTDASRDWTVRQLAEISSHYLVSTQPATIADDLVAVRGLQADDVQIDGTFQPENGTVQLRVLVGGDHSKGCFHRIAGTLAALRLEVLAAEISTGLDNVAIDRFHVVDHDFEGPVTDFRIGEIAQAISEGVRRQVTVRELSERHRVFGSIGSGEPVSDHPTRVVVDVQSSPTRTIVDIFAHDRPGLLYIISRTLFQLGLSVELARIATHVDQVVDVFYVVDRDGNKVEDSSRRDEIVSRLGSAIAHLQNHGLSASAVAATEERTIEESSDDS